ncbi:MAG: hypothetical protein HPY65_17960 [Syntrophaceae bacterium]|nr:hypothetical protein [Syntrophaceae bacterium]
MDENVINRLMKAGKVARVRAYQNLIEMIRAGKPLKPSEMKLMERLERELSPSPVDGEGEKPPERIDGMQAAALYVGSSRRMLSYHIKKGHLRQNPDGSFDRSELDRFLEKYGRKTEEPGSLGEQKAAADLRFRLAKATSAEMNLAREQGELISRDEVQMEWSARNIELKTALLAWANKLPPLLHGRDKREIGTVLRDEVYYLLSRFSRTGRWTPQPSRNIQGKKARKEMRKR